MSMVQRPLSALWMPTLQDYSNHVSTSIGYFLSTFVYYPY